MPDSLEQFNRAITEALARMAVFPGSKQLEQMGLHYSALIETNARFNLTRITAPAEAAVKHYADSLALLGWVGQRDVEARSILDIGTGAGFPAIPLAVMRPDWAVTAIDATRKKIDFVKQVAAQMSLSNLHAFHAHSKHWQPGETFQVVVAKAVGSLGVCLSEAARHLSPQGFIVVYKTAVMDGEEINAGAATAAKSGLQACEPFPYTLELAGETIDRELNVWQG